MAKKIEKTNVMRLLDQKKIDHAEYDFSDKCGGVAPTGVEVANELGKDVSMVFKTLVTQGASKAYYVFVIPVAEELDLKKAAKAVSEKSIAMIKSKDLLGLTGYVHGGCSPIGMKKQFKTVVHESASSCETIMFSAGKIGYQVEMPLASLEKICPLTLADVICND